MPFNIPALCRTGSLNTGTSVSTPPSRERLAELLESCGLTLIEQRTLGQETEGKRAWGGFAIAAVK